jgi:transcriptional regulator with XRE-family HTH domain
VTRQGAPGFDGARLRQCRQQAGLTVSELARAAGVSPQDVSRYESGTMSPGPDRLAALAVNTGVTPRDLVDEAVLGQGLKALRVLAGLTQAGLAELAGPDMTVSRLRSLEMGKVRRLTHADTASLAAALGTSKEAIRAAHHWDLEQAAQASQAPLADDRLDH